MVLWQQKRKIQINPDQVELAMCMPSVLALGNVVPLSRLAFNSIWFGALYLAGLWWLKRHQCSGQSNRTEGSLWLR